jgi:hypothetical protein
LVTYGEWDVHLFSWDEIDRSRFAAFAGPIRSREP